MLACKSDAAAPDAADVAAAAAVLARGGAVVYPTETFYGLGVDATNPVALERLCRLKVRQAGKPISVLVSDIGMLAELAAEVRPAAARLMERFWPGPLTLVLAARPGVAEVLTAGSGIGVRLSSHPSATALVRALGRPVTTPSANPAGLAPPVCVAEARAYFDAEVDYFLDGGTLPGGLASTVVDARGEVRVLRAGAIAAAVLHRALQGAGTNRE